MKKIFKKTKTWIVTFGVAMLSFMSKVVGQAVFDENQIEYGSRGQQIYGVPPSESTRDMDTNTIIKIAPRLLIAITFIVGIVSFIKIRRIDDKDVKEKRIKKAIIITTILIILAVSLLLLPRFLKKYG